MDTKLSILLGSEIFGWTSLGSQLFGNLNLLLIELGPPLFSLLDFIQCLLMLLLCWLGLLLSENISLSELLDFLLGFFNNSADSLGLVLKCFLHLVIKVASHISLLFNKFLSPSFSDSGDSFTSDFSDLLGLFKLSELLGFAQFLLDSL